MFIFFVNLKFKKTTCGTVIQKIIKNIIIGIMVIIINNFKVSIILLLIRNFTTLAK
jgi:hypothetical protein